MLNLEDKRLSYMRLLRIAISVRIEATSRTNPAQCKSFRHYLFLLRIMPWLAAVHILKLSCKTDTFDMGIPMEA